MAADPLATIRKEVGLRVAEIRDAGPRLSPLDLYARMDAIRELCGLAPEALGLFVEVTTGLPDMESDPNKLANEIR